MAHTVRLPYFQLAPKAFKALFDLSATVQSGLLGKRLVDLVFLRVSQINGCGFCIDMHWRDLIRQEVDPRHLNAVAGWREAPFFSERERAALRWAEIVAATPHSDASTRSLPLCARTFPMKRSPSLALPLSRSTRGTCST